MALLGSASVLLAQPQPGTVLWVYDAGVGIFKSPAMGPDGTIYLDLTYSGLCAITNDGSNAGKKWTFPKGGRDVGWPPSVDCTVSVGVDGTVYFGSWDGNLYAVRPDGSQKWVHSTGGGGGGTPAIGLDGTIYYNGWGAFYAFDPDGSLKWQAPNFDTMNWPSPAIGLDGTIYVSNSESSRLSAFNPDGTLRWFVDNPEGIMGGQCPAIGSDGTVYITAGYGFLTATSPEGNSRWSSASPVFGPASPAIDKDNTVYETKWRAGCLCAFKPNGDEIWSGVCYNLGTNVSPTTPAIDCAGTLYYTASNSIVAVNSDRSVRWITNPPSFFQSQGTSPLIGPDGTIYATVGSKLYAIAGTNALAKSPWPMCGRDPRHTGSAERAFFRQPRPRPDGSFVASFYGHLGQGYSIQTSTNLTTWTVLSNLSVINVPTQVVDPTPGNASSRFYRAVSL